MSNQQKLNLNLKQSFSITPQLQKSLELLQMPTIDLAEYLLHECEQNPLLSLNEKEENDIDYKEKNIQEYKENNVEKIDDTFANNSSINEFDYVDDKDYLDNNYVPTFTQNYDEEYDILENYTDKKSLKDYINEQTHSEIMNHQEQLIADFLTNMLEDDGYFRADITEVAQNLGCSVDDVTNILTKMQQFDPPGIFARSLQESIKIQLMRKDHLDEDAAKVIEYIDLIAKSDIKKIHQLTNVSIENIEDIIAEIKTLNPKPVNNFDNSYVETIIPDVFVKKRNNDWIVEVNIDILPKIFINNEYYAIVKDKTKNKSEKKYLNQQIQHANWITKAVDQRAKTILNVATFIVEHQKEFFEKGLKFLKPLKLQDVADHLEIHESTVSRVTSSKYLSSERGIFEMKYFFPTKISNNSNNNNEMANTTIQYLIKDLITNENPVEALSDEDIVLLLKSKNIGIARRTVAKYRSILKIPSSTVRKKV